MLCHFAAGFLFSGQISFLCMLSLAFSMCSNGYLLI